MIRRSPQEIADFFGCYVAQDEAGCFMIYSEKPEFILEDEMYGVKNVWVMANKPEGVFEYITSLVDVPTDHDFHRLYEPNLSEKPTDSVGSAKNETTTKAPHQSEVHTHREYIIMCADNRITLEQYVIDKINHGWELSGGIAVDKGFFYQTIVRGI